MDDDTLPSFTAKRYCPFSASSSSPSSPPSNRLDQLLLSFLSRSESPSFSLALDCSFHRVLTFAIEGSGDIAGEDHIIDCARNLGTLLSETAGRFHRKRATAHNSISWPLSPDLTIRVFAMLDTRTLVCAAATCSLFRNCAMDPFCYSHINLTYDPQRVNNAVVSTMIQRAGHALRSLKLGSVRESVVARRNVPTLTRSCLNPLWANDGAVGKLLRRLYVSQIERMDTISLWRALSACRNLTDLKVVGIKAALNRILEAVRTNCHSIVRLHVKIHSDQEETGLSLSASDCEDFVNKCTNLSSLALIGYELDDTSARILLEGPRKLKYFDLSLTGSFSGEFLRNLRNRRSRDCVLETLMLRDCPDLMGDEVPRFLSSLLAGDFKSIRHIDVSNWDGLYDEEYCRCKPHLPLKKLKEVRPEIRIVAYYPPNQDDEDPIFFITDYSSESIGWSSSYKSYESEEDVCSHSREAQSKESKEDSGSEESEEDDSSHSSEAGSEESEGDDSSHSSEAVDEDEDSG